MYTVTLEEMSDAIFAKLHPQSTAAWRPKEWQDIMAALEDYWREKIAHVWVADDLIDHACNSGFPLTRSHAVNLLKDIGNSIDCENGVTWQHIENAYWDDRDFHLRDLVDADLASTVLGCFRVWIEDDFGGVSDQKDFGCSEDGAFIVEGNFAPALDYARELARQNPGLIAYLAAVDADGETNPLRQLVIYATITGNICIDADEQAARSASEQGDWDADSDDEGPLTEQYENAARLGDEDWATSAGESEWADW